MSWRFFESIRTEKSCVDRFHEICRWQAVLGRRFSVPLSRQVVPVKVLPGGSIKDRSCFEHPSVDFIQYDTHMVALYDLFEIL